MSFEHRFDRIEKFTSSRLAERCSKLGDYFEKAYQLDKCLFSLTLIKFIHTEVILVIVDYHPDNQ